MYCQKLYKKFSHWQLSMFKRVRFPAFFKIFKIFESGAMCWFPVLAKRLDMRHGRTSFTDSGFVQHWFSPSWNCTIFSLKMQCFHFLILMKIKPRVLLPRLECSRESGRLNMPCEMILLFRGSRGHPWGHPFIGCCWKLSPSKFFTSITSRWAWNRKLKSGTWIQVKFRWVYKPTPLLHSDGSSKPHAGV